ncbi:MAG TPA: ABC transporter permease [Actinomycetota bacterium]|jgi:ABC-type spermidine/putrescine transport system permease subunit II|nr:ABC transporter permease [Actinomycetota bacterium]
MSFRRHKSGAFVVVLVLAFLWLPIVFVAVHSFNKDELMVSWAGLTWQWYKIALQDPSVRDGLRTTLSIAALSSAISVTLAVAGALWWRKAPRRGRRVFDALTYARIILPEVVFATALFLFLLKTHVPFGFTAIVIGHVVWNSAYATLIIQARLVALEPSLEEAAADLGAPPWSTFRRVTFATLLPAILAAGLLTFTFSFDDVVTSYFMGGSSSSPLPIVLLGLVRERVTPEVNAIGVMVMLFTLSLIGLAGAMLSIRRGATRERLLATYRRMNA